MTPVESTGTYNPGKSERNARYRVYTRFRYMEGNTDRVNAEQDWEDADAMAFMDIPAPDPSDWRAHLVLPDAFAAIQSQMQETIERNSRPILRRVEDSDKGIEKFQNAILTYNLNRTDFDYQYFLAKYHAAIRGTSFLMDFYRVDKRNIQDPTDVNPDGTLKYVQKEVTDFDDDYTQWIPNEFIYIDGDADDIDNAKDMIHREIVDIDEFHRAWGFRKDAINVDLVHRGGDTSTKSYFRMPLDMSENHVEVLHYYNRATDDYIVCANNIVVRMGPLPTKHKELPLAVVYQYRIAGHIYGIGIPKVVKALTEERASVRNLGLDRQKMQINKMFLKNAAVDFDDDQLITRPHGMVEVETNGLPIRDAIQPIEYGDVPTSAYKSEEILLEDIRRATGIDDRIQGVQVGGTATEASILRENSQKRIGMIARLNELKAIKRIGKLKWSNIQFFYPAPKIERITEDNDEREEKTYKKVSVDGQSFTIVKDRGTGKTELQVNEVEGSTTFTLNRAMARYMDGDFDVQIDAESVTVVSKAIQQAKITEMFQAIVAIPTLLTQLDPRKTLARYLEVNNEAPEDWMTGSQATPEQQMQQAEWENLVMAAGTPLSGTEGATDAHTLEHLNFTRTALFQQLPAAIQEIFSRHILEEHDANPATGSAASLLPGGAGQATPGAPAGPVTGGTPLGQQATPVPGVSLTPGTGPAGEAPNSSTNNNTIL